MRVLFLFFALSGCLIEGLFSPQGTTIAHGTRRMSPPPKEYPTWWVEVSTCTRIEKDFGSVGYYAADSIIRVATGQRVSALWRRNGTIVIDVFYIRWAPIVKHEMVHAFLHGDVKHESSLFDECAPQPQEG